MIIKRRDFLKATATMAGGVGFHAIGCAVLNVAKAVEAAATNGARNAEKLGWRLGAMWRLGVPWNYAIMPTFFEAVDRVASLGLHYIEGSARPVLSKERPEICTDNAMSPHARREMKRRLADRGVQLTSYYSSKLLHDKGKSRAEFEFAKDMGIEILVGEPQLDAFDTVEELSEEYQVKVAVHNHAPPDRFWNPETVLKLCRGRSKLIGACGDTGHWIRSGVDPVDAIRKLGERLISFHFKDMNKAALKGSHEVAWGSGVGNVRGMMAEVQRLGIRPLFVIEYEYSGGKPLEDIARSIKHFDKVAADLAAAKQAKQAERSAARRDALWIS